MNKNNSVTITLPDNGMCAIVRKINGRYEIDTGRIEGKDIFLGPQPNPITGLVPCGCGGKAGFHYSVMLRDNDCYVECGICGGHTKVVLSEDKARDAWNTAMGWKGGLK